MTFKNGVATFTLKHGESKTAQGLPSGIGYTVEESGNEDYEVSKTDDTGTIVAGETATAEFTNHRDIPAPPPQTGDNSHLTPWMFMMIVSLQGV